MIGVICSGSITEVKVTCSAGAIYGDFTSGASTVTLMSLQHLLLQANGSVWIIVAGEPKRTPAYSGLVTRTKAETETGIEPSAIRPALVNIFTKVVQEFKVNGVYAGFCENTTGANITLYVPPGQKWKGKGVCEVSTVLL
jgi:hypothetical protein